MRFKLAAFLVIALMFSAGCKGGEKAKSKPVTQTVKTDSGEKMKRTLVGSEKEKMQDIMKKTISGQVKLVAVHPNPESLPEAMRDGATFVTIDTGNGNLVFPAGELTAQLRNHVGKKVTITGVERRDRASYMGATYPLFAVMEINKVED